MGNKAIFLPVWLKKMLAVWMIALNTVRFDKAFLCILVPQETPGQPSAIYGQINKGRNQKTVSILSIWRLKIFILKLLCSALLTSLRADGVFLSEMGRL